MPYFIYIVECSDTTLYIGSTNDINKRLHHHNHTKQGAKYTRARRPVVLKYFEECENYTQTRKRESQLKKLSRIQKLAIISKNPII